MKKYDITFVLPGMSIRFPAGGYDIVYRLCSALNENNLKCSIIFQTDPSLYIPNYVRDGEHRKLRLSQTLFKRIFYGTRLNHIYKHWEFINKLLFRTDYNYNMLKNTDCYLYSDIKDIEFKTSLIIATAWQTAYFVKEYCINEKDVKPLYFIQNSEDDVSFSGSNSNNATETYTFPFKKIVISEKLYNRFKVDDPFFIHVGIDTDFYYLINSVQGRFNITFPLRKGESKGGEYAIKCIEKLLTVKSIKKIVAFGNFSPDEIPNNIRDKIKYYYLPTRKTLRKIYNESAIFVLPSIVEGMPLPPLEAMSCGSAVIVTDNGGVNEYIENGDNGLMCPVRDSNCLFEKIMYLINNENLRLKFVKNGIETAKSYSYSEMTKQFSDKIKIYL
jgi:glycosyltransferase involved in cell wall biosynthesis